MRPLLFCVLTVVLGVQAACQDRSTPAPAKPIAPTSAPVIRATAASTCPALRGDIRLTPDTIGGLATRQLIGALWHLCPSARSDTAGVGGTSPSALRIDAPGATLWAIQTAHDAYGDSLHQAEPATLWAAEGDSLRFPDGALIPRRVGALRALDSAGVIVVDHGDDGTGSYIVRCKYPELAMVIDNVWPPFADSGVVPLNRASASDTTTVWRVEMGPRHSRTRVIRACAKLRTT